MYARRVLAALVVLQVVAGEHTDVVAAPPRATSTAEPDLSSLPRLLADAHASDPDRRLRARRAAKSLALAYFRAQAPADMRLVPGRFVFGPAGLRMVGGFYLAVHEVRTDAFVAFARAHAVDARRWQERAGSHPVVHVTHAEATAFARARDSRLPTVAELEYAATSCRRFAFPWGHTFDAARANSREGALGRTEPVNARSAGASLQGIVALRGNVAEWAAPQKANSSRKPRLIACGGSFRRLVGRAKFVSYRLRADGHRDDVGFRLARDLPPLPPALAPPPRSGQPAAGEGG